MTILVLNAGSSSLKAALFKDGARIDAARIEEIGRGAPVLKHRGETRAIAPDAAHGDGLAALLDAFGARPETIAATGHRVVHGGAIFTAPTLLDAAALAQLPALNALAPLHNPAALSVIAAAQRLLPGAAAVACFDTAFHATQPEIATRFALPSDARTAGLRRYGFHGLSYAGLVRALEPAVPRRLLACHLGAGASLCAIKNGRSVATTMGYTPLDGLVMGTRSGALDPGAVLELARRIGVDETERLLNRESGLLGLSGVSADMRALEDSDDPRAAMAIAQFGYAVILHAGAMIAALGGLDAIAFTGGVGENAADLRRRICEGLRFTGLTLADAAPPSADGAIHAASSPVAAYVIPADEEAEIAHATAAIISQE